MTQIPNHARNKSNRGDLHFVLSPVVLGQGEAMFTGSELSALGYRLTERRATEHATHIVLSR